MRTRAMRLRSISSTVKRRPGTRHLRRPAECRRQGGRAGTASVSKPASGGISMPYSLSRSRMRGTVQFDVIRLGTAAPLSHHAHLRFGHDLFQHVFHRQHADDRANSSTTIARCERCGTHRTSAGRLRLGHEQHQPHQAADAKRDSDGCCGWRAPLFPNRQQVLIVQQLIFSGVPSYTGSRECFCSIMVCSTSSSVASLAIETISCAAP